MVANSDVHAVVVTFNRRLLLEKCIGTLLQQTYALQRILIINNASTDDTHEWIHASGLLRHPQLTYHLTKENLGGAGGFAIGLQIALEMGADWVWMMDDDAEPETNALSELMKIADEPSTIYGSLAVHGTETAWNTTLLLDDGSQRLIHNINEVPDKVRVQFLPFLGILVTRSLVDKIGLPDAEFFIAADDVEYCLRAKRAGAEIIIAGKSRINHPKSCSQTFIMPWGAFVYLRLPPWKRYYDTRNRLLIARKYHGYRLVTQTLPGSLVRLVFALCCEPHKLAQFWGFAAGLFDGLLGIKGKRHIWWRILNH